MSDLIPNERIEKGIFLIRGKRVMIDRDLAELYGVTTFRLNEQVKRNIKRFPGDFMFQLMLEEKTELIAICDRFKPLKHSTSNPYAFTEQGIAMLSSVLNSERAIQVNIAIIRAFTRLREIMLTHKELREKIEAMEKKYDSQFKSIFDAIRQLIEPPIPKKEPIGFRSNKD